MEAKKALEVLNSERYPYRMITAIMAAIEALEKQVPRKPIEVDEDLGYFVCGNCNFTVGYTNEKEEHKYCLNCGQKLDWG